MTGRTSELPPSGSLRQTKGLDPAIPPSPEPVRPEHCTCGTLLAENARFCHLCGRPVFESDIPAAPVPPPVTAAPGFAAGVPSGLRAAQLSVSFSNPVARRVAFLMSVGVLLVTLIPDANVLLPLWWLVAGSGAVFLYRRITGLSLSVRAGARLGSLTGVLSFVSLVVILALTVAVSGNELRQAAIKQNPQASIVFDNPPALVMGAFAFLLVLFAFVVGFCAVGGALGARFANRDAGA